MNVVGCDAEKGGCVNVVGCDAEKCQRCVCVCTHGFSEHFSYLFQANIPGQRRKSCSWPMHRSASYKYLYGGGRSDAKVRDVWSASQRVFREVL